MAATPVLGGHPVQPRGHAAIGGHRRRQVPLPALAVVLAPERMGVGLGKPVLHRWQRVEAVAEGLAETAIEKQPRLRPLQSVQAHGNRQVLENPHQIPLALLQTLLGQHPIGHIGAHALPDGAAISQIPGDRLRQNPAHLAIDQQARLPAEGQLVGKHMGIESDPGVVVVGVHTGEGQHRIGGGRLPLQPTDHQKSFAHEREAGQRALGLFHHGVSAHRNRLGDRQGGVGQAAASDLELRFHAALLGHVDEAHEQPVVEHDGADEHIQPIAGLVHHLEGHRLHRARPVPGPIHGSHPGGHGGPAVLWIRIG
ncbi:MAG: hypothetical protein ACK56F_31045, partial [bacterium]